MSTPKPDYSAMTANEHLFVAGLLDSFDSALDAADRELAIEVLGQVGLEGQAPAIVGAVFDNPKLYGFPRSN